MSTRMSNDNHDVCKYDYEYNSLSVTWLRASFYVQSYDYK